MSSDVRIGVIHPYWTFWEDAGGEGFKEEFGRGSLLMDERLASYGEVAWSICVGPHDTEGGASPVGVIVIAYSVACPPAAVMAILKRHPSAVVVLWAAFDEPGVPPGLDHRGIVRRGATVGTPMLSAALVAAGRPFDVFAAAVADDTEVDAAMQAAVATARLRASRIGVIGEPLAGYDFARLPREALVALGVEVMETSDEAFAREVVAAVRCRSSVDRPGVEEAFAYCEALDRLIGEHELDAGTLNCHSVLLRSNPEIGVAPCLALGRSTSRGVPWTCTGDLATAFAMLVVAAFGAPTFYNEIEAIDTEREVAVLANSGEFDSRFRGMEGSALRANPWYPAPVPTLIQRGIVGAGPAALVGARGGDDGIVLVVADGEFTGEGHPATGTMNATFRFHGASRVAKGWRRWVAAGIGHHSCATDRHMADAVTRVAHHLGLRVIVV